MVIVVKFIAVTAVLFCLIISAFFIYNTFQLKTLIITSNKSKINGLSILNDKNLLINEDKKIIDYLQKQNPTVKSISIAKKFPQTILMYIEDRIPVARIMNNQNDIYIDGDGVIINDGKTYSNLPKISIGVLSVYLNQKTDWRIMKALSFLSETKKQGIIIEQISIDDLSGSFIARTSYNTDIFIPYDSDMSTKASSLQVIILRFRIEGKNITRVDFRYDKPLVTLSNGEKMSSSF